MQHYEIRVLEKDRAQRTVACIQVSDHAAVRRAVATAKPDEGFEVWRGDVCVYARRGPGGVNGDI